MRSINFSDQSTGTPADDFFARWCIGVGQNLDETEYAKPLPWVGLYVAAASIFLGLLMFLDFYRIMRYRKNLFTPRWFTLNAATLTILAIATKLSVDLTTPMPTQFDQLSKISGNVLICIVMANLMPSLGDMDSSSILSNIIALTIFVITVIVNTCIQIRTGVIYFFQLGHIFTMVSMFFSLLLFAFSVLAVPAYRRVLEDKFQIKYNSLTKDYGNVGVDEQPESDADRLCEPMKRYWLLALSRRPIVDTWAMHTLSLYISLLLAFIMIYTFNQSRTWRFCRGDSHYGWSTPVIFYSQAGTIFVVILCSLYFKCVFAYEYLQCYEAPVPENDAPSSITGRYGRVISRLWEFILFFNFTAEGYCKMQLHGWRYGSLLSNHTSRYWRKMEYLLNSCFFWSIVHISELNWTCRTSDSISPSDESRPSFRHIPDDVRNSPVGGMQHYPLERFVLNSERQDVLIRMICRREKDVDEWIEIGKKNKPTKLMESMARTREERWRFEGVARIFDRRVCSLVLDRGLDEPQNCWAMPIVTLFSIAMTIPGVVDQEKESLLEVVHQGLKYVRFVEHQFDSKGLTYNAREEAKFLWKSIELCNKWYDEDLQPQDPNGDAKQKLEYLADKGQEQFERLTKGQGRNYILLPGKAIAWDNMYRIAKTIGIQYYDYSPRNITIFDWIRETISDTITACLSNLPRAIYVQCTKSDHLDIEKKIRNAAYILGETEAAMTSEHILGSMFSRSQDEMQKNLGDDRRPYIDEWIKEVREQHSRSLVRRSTFPPRLERQSTSPLRLGISTRRSISPIFP